MKTLTADDNYSLLNRGNLTEPIHVVLSEKQKDFFAIFFEFLKLSLNFDHFLKPNVRHS